jgi:hypothetical protein
MHYVPEVTKLESQDDQNSTVSPYYSNDSAYQARWEDYVDDGDA